MSSLCFINKLVTKISHGLNTEFFFFQISTTAQDAFSNEFKAIRIKDHKIQPIEIRPTLNYLDTNIQCML